ncbi:MAG: CcmD family protein [Candidatus Zixiibacteriota bacterium]
METSNYTVLFANLVIWAGIFLFLFRLDKKVKDMEKMK